MQFPELAPIKPINLPDLKPIDSKKQSLQEWHAAGGGVPKQYKGREHVWHAKVKQFAAGGEAHMGAGGVLKKMIKSATEAPTIIVPSRLSETKEAIRQKSGDYAARRLERAADEIPNLEKLYKEEAIRRAFVGDNAKAVATMKPQDFQKYAIELRKQTSVGPNAAAMARKGDISKGTVPTDEYIKHLQRVNGGFDDVPYLELFKDEVGIPSKPRVSGHEGRHRNLAMAENDEPAGLVLVYPRGDLREGLPRRHQDEYINALREELDLSGNLVFPESNPMYDRQPIKFPDVYAKGGEVHMAGAGDPLDEFSPPRYRSAGRRPENQNDRRAAANMPIDFARGVASGVLGAPGDIESLIRMLPGLDERTVLPTSEDIEKRIPLRSDTPAGRAAAGLGTLAGGFYMGPGAPIRLVGGLPQAVYKAGKDFGRAAGQPAANVVKPTGGNFLTGRVEKDLAPLRRRVTTEAIQEGRYTPEQAARLAADPQTKANDALNKWVDSNLTNYVKKQMGTPDDPVRKLAEEGITHKPGLVNDYYQDAASDLRKQRKEAGFPEEGMGQSPTAKGWERASDESLATHRAGDIQDMPEKFAKFTEAERNMGAARASLDRKFAQHIENAGLNDREKASLIRGTPFNEKAKMVGDTDLAKANEEFYALQSPMMSSYIALGRENPYISKLDPETRLYAPFTGDLGFDHIMDVLREDVTAGRIRPDQLNKVSMEQAVRRTYQYDQEMAAKMNASRAAAREGLPTYREYPEGYKWIELNKPGAFAQESEAMGHSVRGYEPPKGHPDWSEGSGDSGSSSYGHGGWEAIKSGKAKVYSLVDPKGAPHATVETKQIGMTPEQRRYKVGFLAAQLEKEGQTAENALRQAEKIYPEESKESISQIKGKGNRAPNEEYLPYIQDFVKSGKWSDVGDIQNTGLRRTSDVFGPTEMQKFKENGIELPSHLNADEQKAMQDKWYTLETGKNPDTGMAHGGAVRMSKGGAAKEIVEAGIKGVKKLLGMADEVPKGVEEIVVKPKVDHPLVFPRATPKTKEDIRPIAQRMAEQVTGDFVRQNPKLTTNPAGKSRKQYNREQEIPLETRRLTEEKPTPYVDYASKKGSILVGVPGDPTLGGVAKRGSLEESTKPTVELTRVGNITPDSPVPLFGGPRYGDEEKFWASNYGAAAPIQNNATELSRLYEAPVLGQYIKMAPGSENFAVHNLDALLAIQQPEKLSKSNLRSLNSLIKQGSLKYGKFPGFAGFEDPIDVLLQAQLNPKLRKHIAEILTKPTITDSLGLSSGLDVVAAITHPQLRNLETGASGFSIGEMRPGSDLRQFRGAHPTYDTDIPGAAIGQSRYPIPVELAFPDTTAYARSQMKPGVQEFNMIKMLGPRERIDQQYIDEMKMYEELMKQYTGKKKGGAVNKPKKPSRATATTD